MHTCYRATDAYPQLEDATIDLDLDGPHATLIASGRLGPRSAAVARTMLDALDAVPHPIHVRADGVREVAEEFVSALLEAQVRRRILQLPGLELDGASDADTDGATDGATDGDRAGGVEVLRAAVLSWDAPTGSLS